MAVDKQLRELEEGDIVQGGTFMQALSDELIDWLVVEPYDDVVMDMVVEPHWLGVSLGLFQVDSKGCHRVEA